jgi:hypothetical protein
MNLRWNEPWRLFHRRPDVRDGALPGYGPLTQGISAYPIPCPSCTMRKSPARRGVDGSFAGIRNSVGDRKRSFHPRKIIH